MSARPRSTPAGQRARKTWALAVLALAGCAALGAWLAQRLGARPWPLSLAGRQLELGQPFWLSGLALLPALALLSWPRQARTAQRAATFVLRALLLALLLLAISRPVQLLAVQRDATLVLIDVSRSIEADFLQQVRARVAELCRAPARGALSVLSFARQARRVPFRCGRELPELRHADGSATDIEGALAFALAQLEPDATHELLLFSDGVETQGAMANLAAPLRAAGVRLWYEAPAASATPEVGIERLDLPESVKAGAPFAVRATLSSTHAGHARLRLSRDGKPEPDGDVPLLLHAGANAVAMRAVCQKPGEPVYRLELLPEGPDRLPENNVSERPLRVLGKPRVLLVERERSQAGALRELLSAAGFELDVRGPEGAPRTRAELSGFDFYILSDVPRAALPDASAAAIAAFLEQGGGFLMAGGEQSFGLGGYRGSPFEALLPVALERREKHEEPTLALALVIDKSGSMNDEKIALAKEAARATASLLRDDDYLGVIGFDATPVHVVRMASVQNRSAVERGIERLKAGGGTAIFPALDAAYADLSGVRARKKHVILLTDGQTRESGLDVLVQNMQLSDITLSTVGLGEDVSRGLLEELARLGHGHAYFTDDPKHVPRLFLHDTESVARSAAVEADVTALVATPADFLKQVHIALAPPLRGYVATTARAEPAQVILETAAHEPLLARMRVGLGWSLAFTSDLKPRWAASWFAWPDFSRMLAQLVREHMRAERGSDLRIEARSEADELLGEVEVTSAAQRFVNGLSGEMWLRRPQGGEPLQRRALRQVAPGAYQARFTLAEPGSYVLEAQLSGAAQPTRAALGFATYAYPAEYRNLTPRPQALGALAAATGGGPLVVDAHGSVRAAAPRPGPPQRRPLWPYPVAAALLTYLVELGLRRLWPRARTPGSNIA